MTFTSPTVEATSTENPSAQNIWQKDEFAKMIVVILRRQGCKSDAPRQ